MIPAVKFNPIVMVPIDRVHANSWNPNEQSDLTFNELAKEVEEDGFDGAVNVVPIPKDQYEADWDKEVQHYRIIGGEHRWKVLKGLGSLEIPCIIHEEWDELKQKLKTVRRNLLTGSLNPRKFTDLVRDVGRHVDLSTLPNLMGFESTKEFEKFLIKDKDSRDTSFIDSLLSETKKEKVAIDSLTDIVATLFADASATVDQNFLTFTYGGSLVTVVLCDKPCLDAVRRMTEQLKESGGTATEFLTKALNEYLGF